MTELLIIMVTNVLAFIIGAFVAHEITNWGWRLRARTMMDMESNGQYFKVREVIYDHIQED